MASGLLGYLLYELLLNCRYLQRLMMMILLLEWMVLFNRIPCNFHGFILSSQPH